DQKPLEIQHKENRKLLLKLIEGNNLVIPEKIGGCFNINKNLVTKILQYLKDQNIDKNTIYPNLYRMKTDCLNMEWEKHKES
ncbi:MAG TPA: hypothetical protein VE912_00025, partial [Bacteroidales bacterium]|nr:hypothetical protein [Bacteroidales bacterium]